MSILTPENFKSLVDTMMEATAEEEQMWEDLARAKSAEIEALEAKDVDMVNHPPHYTQGEIECIDAMIAARGKEAVATYCELAAFKYLWRLGLKDEPTKELGKIEWYAAKAKALRS